MCDVWLIMGSESWWSLEIYIFINISPDESIELYFWLQVAPHFLSHMNMKSLSRINASLWCWSCYIKLWQKQKFLLIAYIYWIDRMNASIVSILSNFGEGGFIPSIFFTVNICDTLGCGDHWLQKHHCRLCTETQKDMEKHPLFLIVYLNMFSTTYSTHRDQCRSLYKHKPMLSLLYKEELGFGTIQNRDYLDLDV